MWFEQGYDKPISDFADVQQYAVDIAKDGDVFVEVGSFVGESMAAMIDMVKVSGKRISVVKATITLVEVTLCDICQKEICQCGEEND